MKKSEHKKIAVRMFVVVFAMYVLSVLIGGFGFFLITSNLRVQNAFVFIIAGIVVLTAVAAFVARLATKGAGRLVQRLEERNSWFESIVDAVPYPIHVTDNDMKWVFMNKAFEVELKKGGIPYDRNTGCGQQCSNANATICNTEGCGIRQLQKGVGESYFDWHGYSMKQSTAVLKNLDGQNIGYVEVVTDLTSVIRLNEFSAKEIGRIARNLDKLAVGNLELDYHIGESNEYIKAVHEQIQTIDENMQKVSGALQNMIADTTMLTHQAIEGNLSVRADAGRHQGEYAKIVSGVNTTLDAIVTPITAASQAVEKLAEGQQFAMPEYEFKGDFKELVDDIEGLKNALSFMINQVQGGIEAIELGDISHRCDKGQLRGTYAFFVDKLNEMFDVFGKPLNESKAVLARLSINDYTQKMQGEYNGVFKELAESINQVIVRLLSSQDAFIRAGRGDLSRLAEFRQVGKRSENDRMMPAVIDTYQAIQDLIDEAGKLTAAASAGNLELRGDAAKFEGGYRQIIEGINATLDTVVSPINELVSVLAKMDEGDLSKEMKGDYQGDYLRLKQSLNHTITTFSQLLSEINVSAGQVASGSRQVSDSAQDLSMGSTEQASAIQQLTASLDEISSQTRLNAENSNQANTLAATAKETASKGNTQMQSMLDAMNDISASSANISKIIKVIDDIAFQTNILALNAAVEAARAGQYGKGFAVVAEEVRNLAAKSADAAKDTTALIESSIEKIEGGTKMAGSTARALNKIQEAIDQVAELVGGITAASSDQATGIAQVSQGIAQISQVTQTNSATAEESAAASEELSGQAEMLRQMVSRFELAGDMGQGGMLPAPEQRKSLPAAKKQAAPQSFGAQAPAKPALSRPHALHTLQPGTSGKKPTIGLPNDDFGKY